MKRTFKNNKAITLIALVITIVILIILAGVAISLSLRNNGLFNKAKEAKEKYLNAQNYEEEQIAKATNDIDSIVDGNRGIKPHGSINISANGEYDVTEYAIANVNVVDTETNSNNRVYLYKNGNEFEDATGGWEGYIYENGNENVNDSSAGFYEKGTHTLNFGDYGIDANGDGGFKTISNIDLSQYSKLYIDFANYSCNFISRSGYPQAANYYVVDFDENEIGCEEYKSNSVDSHIYEIDVSEINSSGKLKIRTGCQGWAPVGKYIASASVYAIWLEK